MRMLHTIPRARSGISWQLENKPPCSNRLVANIPLQDALDVGTEPPHVRAVALLHKAQMERWVTMNPARQSVDGLAGIATWEDFAGYFPATEHDERGRGLIFHI